MIVAIDYGGSAQLRYDVYLPELDAGPPRIRYTYEGLLGFGLSGWNQIEEHQEDQAMAVLQDVVRETVKIVLAVKKNMPGTTG